MPRIAGTLTFTVNGQKYTVGEGTFTVNVSGVKREMIPGTDDYKETKTNTFIKGEVTTPERFKTKTITDLKGATVQVAAANGTGYLIRDAVFTGEPEVQVSEGKLPVEFSAGPDKGEEI